MKEAITTDRARMDIPKAVKEYPGKKKGGMVKEPMSYQKGGVVKAKSK